MYIIYDDLFLKHDPGMMHPESRDRLPSILDKLKGWEFEDSLSFTGPGQADPDLVALIHDKTYIHKIARFSEKGGHNYLDGDTVVSEYTYQSALLAAAGAAKGIDLVFDAGGTAAYFALVRPPGHHAFRGRGSGFCIFNNIAIAAAYAFKHYGLKKIAIIDFDAHHGNGTQEVFYNSSNLFYISFHQYPHYPGTGYYDQTGIGEGRGYSLNFPFAPGTGEDSYIAAFSQVIIPMMEKFNPQLILVSAGYDSHQLDQLASLNLATDSYLKIMYLISYLSLKHCGGKTGIMLEGGYNTEVLGDCVKQTILGSSSYAERNTGEITDIIKRGRQIKGGELFKQIKSITGIKGV
ncbi:MAG: histone deacetylase family protein [Actinomycetota bacterium]